jgi:hypothetical protein
MVRCRKGRIEMDLAKVRNAKGLEQVFAAADAATINYKSRKQQLADEEPAELATKSSATEYNTISVAGNLVCTESHRL